MNDKRKILLLKALKNGRITTKTANRLYSGSNGKDALISLEYQGYLERDGFGSFKPNIDASFPEEVVEQFRSFKEKESLEA